MRTTNPVTIQRHVLPGEKGGDTAWFRRQNPFEQQEICRQVAFKRRCWSHLPDGAASKRPTCTYPHILPAGHERLALLACNCAERVLPLYECENPRDRRLRKALETARPRGAGRRKRHRCAGL